MKSSYLLKPLGNQNRLGVMICNVCTAEKRTKRSSNILVCLVRFSAVQTLAQMLTLGPTNIKHLT